METTGYEKQVRTNLQQFVQNLLDENFADANESLQAAVREKLKIRVQQALKEND